MNLPNNVEAERAFLSVLISKPELIRQYEGLVRPDDFYRHANGQIYDSLVRLVEANKPVDIITLVNDLSQRELLHSVGGIVELTALQTIETGDEDKGFLANGYAGIILDCSRRREGYRVFATAAQQAVSGEELDSLLALAKDTLQNAAHDLKDDVADVQALKADWREWFKATKERGETPGVKTGLNLLDYITGGFQNSTLVVLGARPNMGKTALALNFAAQACKDKRKVAFFSLEMKQRELMSRLVASEAHISARSANLPALVTPDEMQRIKAFFEKMNGWGLFVDDSYSLPVSQIAARARRLQNAGGLDMVIIDHLNYIGSEGKSENRTNEVRKITAALKGLAKELDIPVICLCQLSRGLESRSEKRPELSDLRESGTIEQDADIVLLLYRDGYYTKDDGDDSAELRIAKHRGGKLGTIQLRFDAEHLRFTQAQIQSAWKKGAVPE